MAQTEPKTAEDAANQDSSVKETVISIIIAFVVAFVFRGFVLEPFLIPTGSMAPTLMGAHMRFAGPETGYTWPVGPISFTDGSYQTPTPLQRDTRQGSNGDFVVTDPMSRERLTYRDVPARSGDRIFVLKSLYNVLDPSRFDVIVFKNPNNPQENYIKRLVGLPGEEIALVDGDVFVRPAQRGEGAAADPRAWDQSGWRIARKPERVQRAVWQPVFDSAYTPLSSLQGGGLSFKNPWRGTTPSWEIDGKRVYTYSGAGPTALEWDGRVRAIDDFYPYNEVGPLMQKVIFPVSDVRVAFGVRPSAGVQGVGVLLRARRHEFRAEIAGTQVVVRQREYSPESGEGGAWTTLGAWTMREPLPTDRFTSVEVWHADQSVQVWVDGRQIGRADYDWTPAERVRATFGMSIAEVLAHPPRAERAQGFADPSIYPTCEVRIEFSGGPVEVSRAALWRDLHYQAALKRIDEPGSATDPRTTPALGPDHFFVCGDNSPNSADARLWTSVDPWVAEQIDPTVGVVHRDLLVGKAFFVYFPAPVPTRRLWLPDFGRLRFIW